MGCNSQVVRGQCIKLGSKNLGELLELAHLVVVQQLLVVLEEQLLVAEHIQVRHIRVQELHILVVPQL